MRVLIDTHILLWAITDPKRLSKHAESILLDTKNQIYVSAASIWEIAIKHQKSPLLMPIGPDEVIVASIESNFLMLDITAQHAAAVGKLPLHHADPFDRLLIAQAQCEPLTLLTNDAALAQYSELVILV